MAYVVADGECEIDLSKLINYTMSFQPLQLLFEDIAKRLKQSEDASDRQGNELTLLRLEMEELRKRDADREAQLQELLRRSKTRQQDSLQKHEEKVQDTLPKREEDVQDFLPEAEEEIQDKLQTLEEYTPENDVEEKHALDEGGEQLVDLRAIWSEIERIKSLIGRFTEPKNIATVEQLYEARRRHSAMELLSANESEGRHSPASQQACGVTGLTVDEVILSRANEDLEVDLELSTKSEAPSGELIEPQRFMGDESSELRRQGGDVDPVQPFPAEPKSSEELQKDSDQVTRPPSAPWGSDRQRSTSALPAERARGSALLTRKHSQDHQKRDSLFKRVQKDEEDIGRLNRIVAETLNELKVLQKDVDKMRAVTSQDIAEVPKSGEESLATELRKLRDRVNELEKRDPGYHYAEDGDDTMALSPPGPAEISDEHASEPYPASTPKGLSASGRGGELNSPYQRDSTDAALKDMNNRLRKVENELKRLGENYKKMLPARLGELSVRSTSGTEEKPHYTSSPPVDGVEHALDTPNAELPAAVGGDMLDNLWMAVRKLQDQTCELNALCTALENKKQDKGSAPRSPTQRKEISGDGKAKMEDSLDSKRNSNPMERSSLLLDARDNDDLRDPVKDLTKRLNDLQNRLASVEGNVHDLDDRKADYTRLQQLSDDICNLRQLLEMENSKDGPEGAAAAVQRQEEQIQNLQKEVTDHIRLLNNMRDSTTNELGTLREYVEHIDRCKADAQLVANKAERDYVENALERLMREVEQVLNTTNASLIDTLDKSLNILRDMLDGKAGKEDLATMQRIVSEGHDGGGAPDALLGFRGFRCLGCNRPVDKMRPRSLGSRLQPFVNRLPQNLPPEQSVMHIQDAPPICNTVKDAKPSSV
uniref:Uncharacterized protein n=1 Tax=Trypanosoma congolense (strain IL3000) TaxID=1068625 RepID=G0UQ24_TRYCI|nr:conserved hypothetical protein [Trypanosoma congolense IL3000]